VADLAEELTRWHEAALAARVAPIRARVSARRSAIVCERWATSN